MEEQTRNNTAYIVAGTVAALVLIGGIIPESRAFVSDMTKSLMTVLTGLVVR